MYKETEGKLGKPPLSFKTEEVKAVNDRDNEELRKRDQSAEKSKRDAVHDVEIKGLALIIIIITAFFLLQDLIPFEPGRRCEAAFNFIHVMLSMILGCPPPPRLTGICPSSSPL